MTAKGSTAPLRTISPVPVPQVNGTVIFFPSFIAVVSWPGNAAAVAADSPYRTGPLAGMDTDGR